MTGKHQIHQIKMRKTYSLPNTQKRSALISVKRKFRVAMSPSQGKNNRSALHRFHAETEIKHMDGAPTSDISHRRNG
jgi:hypothetical protein